MKLTLDDVEIIMAGCHDAAEENGEIRFHRMPEHLADFYRRNPASKVRLECTTFVRLRFISDTASMRIGLHFHEAARPFYKGVLLADGREHAAFGPEQASPYWEGRILEGHEEKESLFDIWMPHLVRADLVFLELDDNSVFKPAPPLSRRWLACGDSITQGMTVPLPTQALAARAALSLNLDVMNYGIGGAIMSKELSEAEITFPYDVLTVAYGTNDWRIQPLDNYSTNLRQFLVLQKKAHPAARIAVITPTTWVGNEKPNDKGISLDDYRRAAADVAKGLGFCSLVDGLSLIPGEARMFVDNVHPNEAGMSAYAERLALMMNIA